MLGWPDGITLVEDPGPARPVVDALADIWAEDPAITALVPGGHEAYVRVLYPAEGPAGGGEGREGPVSWNRVGEWCGRSLHHEMQFRNLAVPGREGADRPWGRPPGLHTGMESIRRLLRVMAEGESEPGRWSALVWNGFAGLQPDGAAPLMSPWAAWLVRFGLLRRPSSSAMDLGGAGTLDVHGQDFYLLRGSARAMDRLMGDPPLGVVPSYWWDDKKNWFLSTHFDFDCAYLGGPEILARRVAEAAGLEVWFKGPQARLRRDPVNG